MAIVRLVQETGAKAVFFNHLYDPISLVRDNEVKAALAGMKIYCQSFNADVLYEPWEVLDDSKQPFTCYQNFWDKYAHSSLCLVMYLPGAVIESLPLPLSLLATGLMCGMHSLEETS